jgi:hypothetical protein
VSWKSEREAREKADEILRRASGRGEDVGGEYGSGRLTRAQRKSQEKHIEMKPAGSKIARKLWG